MKHCLQTVSTVFAIMLACSHFALANGVFRALPGYDIPSIPVQRAMIVYRDGRETLTVASTYETASPDVAWIVPLPTVPSQLEAGDDGLLETLCLALQPRIVKGAIWPSVLAYSLLVCGILLITVRALIKGNVDPVAGFLVIACFVIFPMLAVPTYTSGSGSNAMLATAADDTRRVGNYDINVLQDADGASLDHFLADHKLRALDKDARAVFDEYARRGWCLVVARLHSDEVGVKTPHPLVATFPTTEPVFPMRATRLAGTKTRVELVVIADEWAAASGFACAGLAKFQRGYYPYGGGSGRFSDFSGIEHPDVWDVLWQQCRGTRLVADLKPSQMSDDVTLSFDVVPSEPRPVIPRGTKIAYILDSFVAAAGLVLILLSLARMDDAYSRTRVGRIGMMLFAAGATIALTVVFTVPSVGAMKPQDAARAMDSLHDAARQAISEGRLNKSVFNTPEKVLEILHATNPYSGQPLALRRSPGNCALVQKFDRYSLCFYDYWGHETEIELPDVKPPASQPTAGGWR